MFVGKHTQYYYDVHGSRGRWPHTFRKQAQYRHVDDGCGGVPGRGIHLSWEIFDVLSSYFEHNRHRIHTEQDVCGTYLNQNRHGTVSTYTTGMEAYLDDVHLPRGYRHYISSCHKYHDDVTGRTQTRPFEERIGDSPRGTRQPKFQLRQNFFCLDFFRLFPTCGCRKSIFELKIVCFHAVVVCRHNFFLNFSICSHRKSLIICLATLLLVDRLYRRKLQKCQLATAASRKNENKWKTPGVWS